MLIEKNELIDIIMGSEELLKHQKEETIECINCCMMYDYTKYSMWIPCELKLPMQNGFYLVTFKGEYVEYLFFDYAKQEWYFVADGREENNTEWRELAKDVIAWMELPQPYKKGEL